MHKELQDPDALPRADAINLKGYGRSFRAQSRIAPILLAPVPVSLL